MPYRSIEDPAKLRRVLEATLLLEADLELPTSSAPHRRRGPVHDQRSLWGARRSQRGRYALAEFVTVGLEATEEARDRGPADWQGRPGAADPRPAPDAVGALGDHRRSSSGFPPGHPPMTSFLGVPIKVRNEVYGNLYLTDKIGWSEFTSDDEAVIGPWPWPPGSPSRTPASMRGSRRSPSTRNGTGWPVTSTTR